MGSRLKQNPERTFNWFFEATCPVARDKDPGVTFQFPEDFSDEESSQTLLRFCFPYDVQRARDGFIVQNFTFVLTDLEGCQQFGFCRLTSSTHSCLCILSYLPWFEVFYKLLNNLADYLAKAQVNETKALLAALYKQSTPLADGSVTLQMVIPSIIQSHPGETVDFVLFCQWYCVLCVFFSEGEQILIGTELSHSVGHTQGQEGIPYFIAPDPRSLPSIPENRNLTEMIVAVDVGNLLQLYASMLFERRILIFASKLSTLTSCVHAFSAVLYPMYWQHIFIPVLPPHLLDYCCAPMPYLIGVHTSLSERVRSRGLEEVVILNVDTNTLETPFDDLKRIPSDVTSRLKVCLKRQAVSPGCGVSWAFLKAQALLFGGYRDALQCNKEGEIQFYEELFLNHKSPSMKQFLQSAVHLQFFKQFIDGRLDILNNGKEPDDLFEEEIIKCETSGRSKSYQQLVGNLKKGGGALILNMKTKANMRTKGFTKSGLKNLLIHKSHNENQILHRGGSMSHRRAQSDSLQNRLPITQHFGKSRPRRPTFKRKDKENTKDTDVVWERAVSGPADEPDSELQKDDEDEDGDESPRCDSEEMDLLGEIFDTLSARSSHDRGVLYGTRSLDLFGPDSHDFITKCGPANPSQESLSLSISGSGSLHSWNLETTEELSDLTEDSDCLWLDTSLPEEEGAENLPVAHEMMEGQTEDREKQKETNAAINRKQAEEETHNRNNFQEVKLEEEKTQKDPREDGVNETTEAKENEGLKEKRKDDKCWSEEEGHEREINKIQQSVTEEEEKVTNVKKSNGPKELLDMRIKLNSVEEQTAVPPETQIHAEDLKPANNQEQTREIPPKNEKQAVQPTSSPSKVTSAAARFQSQASTHGFQIRSIPKVSAESVFRCREKTQTHPPGESDSNKSTETPEEEELPPLKVSELKKRFEA